MRIDAHQHYWKIDRGDYGWITSQLPVLYRDYMPVDLEPLLNKHGFHGSILVQAAPTLEETDYILSIAERTASVLGVVGWLDLLAPDHAQQYERLCRNPKFKGFRVMIQDMPDLSVLKEPSYVEALQDYAEKGVPVDLLFVAHQIEAVLELLLKVPKLRGVIDHIGKPSIQDKELEPWRRYMSEIARLPGIYCKLSGMVTEGDHKHWGRSDFLPYIQTVLELFGPERVMYGSDWPVCLLAAEYSEVEAILLDSLPATWSDVEYRRLFGANAKEFYRL